MWFSVRNRKRNSLHHKWESAALALISERTIADAARKVGVTDQCIYKWMNDSEFLAMYRSKKAAIVERAVGTMADCAVEAVTSLRGLLQSKKESVRARVGLGILDQLNKSTETSFIMQRISELEARIVSLSGGEPLEPIGEDAAATEESDSGTASSTIAGGPDADHDMGKNAG